MKIFKRDKEFSEMSELIQERWDVNFSTGIITNKRSGKIATGVDSYGYIQCHCGFLGSRRLMLKGHQIVFLLYHEYLPESIDHWDRIKINNSISNLRPATQQEQCRNKGKIGVRYRKSQHRWRATIRPDFNSQLEKTFIREEDAWAWRKKMEVKYWGKK